MQAVPAELCQQLTKMSSSATSVQSPRLVATYLKKKHADFSGGQLGIDRIKIRMVSRLEKWTKGKQTHSLSRLHVG